ncbi:hypothetical protein [Bradyrhizobium sp.]
MVKMVRLEKTASDRKAEKDALGEGGIASVTPDGDSGISIHLDHHHLEKMGIGGGLKAGGKVELTGKGTVLRSESRSTPEGDRHSATIHLSHGGMDYEGSKDDEKSDLRGEIEKNAADKDDGKD